MILEINLRGSPWSINSTARKRRRSSSSACPRGLIRDSSRRSLRAGTTRPARSGRYGYDGRSPPTPRRPSTRDRLVRRGLDRQRSGQRVAVVPWHPELGARRKRVGVQLQLRQVVERVRLVQLARVDQAHEQIANLRPITGLVEQGILAVQDGLLQGKFAHVVVQRRTGLTQEQRQLLPVLQRIADRTAEGRIGFGTLLAQLPLQPITQRLHRRPARLLMEPQ